eukprot:7328499-Ditylum_brightwellii.AAC.1
MADKDKKVVKLVRLPTFDGEQKNFQIWWVRFWAFGMVYGFGQSIGQEIEPSLRASQDANIDLSADDGIKAAKAIKLNAFAMCNLTKCSQQNC